MNLSPANLGILTIQYERELFPMKKTFRILAVVLAATMLMCCCAFAINDEKRPLTRDSWGCDCGRSNSYAYTSANDAVGSISCSFTGTITLGNGMEVGTGASDVMYNYDYSYCNDSSYTSYAYPPAAGYIYASHAIENSHYNSQSAF